MGMKIIRLSDAAFVGDDGQEVLGMYVYLVPNGNVGQPERVFLSEKKMEDICMAALVATIATFFSGVMGMVSTLTTTIVGDDLLVLGVVAVPLVGISVGLLSRLFRQRV